MKESLSKMFCSCVKQVRKSLKGSRKDKEGRAIAICTRTMLQKKRGITLRKFKCGKRPLLKTQPLLSH